MDWAKVKSAIGTIAPWIAGTLESPVAGVAVKALVDVFGLSGDSGTPGAITAALAGATPQQLQDLRAADLHHQKLMAQLGYAHLDQLEQYNVQDRDSARQREASIKDNTPKWLAALAVVLMIATIADVAIGPPVPDPMRDGFWLLVGAIIATYKDVFGYYFGSSHGSQAKDATIKAMAGGDGE